MNIKDLVVRYLKEVHLVEMEMEMEKMNFYLHVVESKILKKDRNGA